MKVILLIIAVRVKGCILMQKGIDLLVHFKTLNSTVMQHITTKKAISLNRVIGIMGTILVQPRMVNNSLVE